MKKRAVIVFFISLALFLGLRGIVFLYILAR